MDFYTFIEAWIVSVLAMTFFSIIISKILKMELREHYLLAHLMHSIKKETRERHPNILKGWVLHFAVGLFFLAFYELLWKITHLERTFLWALIFGIGMGFLGIAGWKLLFKIHPKPPNINYTVYYIQLVIAHIIFSLAAFMIYHLMQ
jgi:hypothetical protein